MIIFWIRKTKNCRSKCTYVGTNELFVGLKYGIIKILYSFATICSKFLQVDALKFIKYFSSVLKQNKTRLPIYCETKCVLSKFLKYLQKLHCQYIFGFSVIIRKSSLNNSNKSENSTWVKPEASVAHNSFISPSNEENHDDLIINVSSHKMILSDDKR